MPIDPQAKVLLDLMPPMPDFAALDLALIRAGMAQGPLSAGDPEPVARVENRTVPGPAGKIPVRVYTPMQASRSEPKASEGHRAGLVFFHGGGFVLCNLDTHDGICRSLANAAGCVVVSVDYRLAPEHPYPAAPEDCYAVTEWVAKNGAELGIDVSRLAIGGDSAGGNLAAVVALMARDRGGPSLRFQLMIYPVTDCAFDTLSYRENAEGYFLTTGMMRWFWEKYLADPAQGGEAYASPLRAQNIANLPPGLCITAGYDPLRDEGEAYAERLRKAGVDVRTTRYAGMFHGFFSMTGQLDKAREALAEAATALRAALA
jgi:acetyl esterase/lipase